MLKMPPITASAKAAVGFGSTFTAKFIRLGAKSSSTYQPTVTLRPQ